MQGPQCDAGKGRPRTTAQMLKSGTLKFRIITTLKYCQYDTRYAADVSAMWRRITARAQIHLLNEPEFIGEVQIRNNNVILG